jgi:hypothetical protein
MVQQLKKENSLNIPIAFDNYSEETWEYLACPPFSSDLGSSNLHFYGPIKKYFEGKHVRRGDGMKAYVRRWVQTSSSSSS